MQAFGVKISETIVDKYIDGKSLNGFSQQVESSSYWDFWLDSISFKADRSVVSELNASVLKLENLTGEMAQIFYYGNVILTGLITAVSYDSDSDDIDFEIDSFAKIISKVIIGIPVLDEDLNTFKHFHMWPENKPFSIEFILKWLIYYANFNYEIIKGYGTKRYILKKTSSSVVPYDFEFMKAVEVENILLSGTSDKDWNSLEAEPKLFYCRQRYGSALSKIEPRYHGYMGKYWVGVGYNSSTMYLRELTKDGLDNNVRGMNRSIYIWFMVPPQEFDDQFDVFLKLRFPENTALVFNGKAIIDNFYFCVCNNKLYKIYYDPVDKFIVSFKDKTVGEILLALAIVKNAVVHIGSDNILYFVNRDGLGGLEPKTPISYNSETMENRTDDPEFDEGVILNNIISRKIKEYYRTFMLGRFKAYSFVFLREEFVPADFPLPMKALPVVIDGKIIDAGIIKNIEYEEFVLKIKTEKRI